MRGVRITFYAGFAVILLVLGAVLAWKLLIQGERPGFIFIGVLAVLAALAALCLYSAEAAGRGRGKAVARPWLFIFTLAFFYALTDFVGGQIFIRTTPLLNFPDEQVHHRMPPRKRFVMHDPDSGAEIEMVTNNLGFRGSDIGEKDPGVYRIVVLGDSFTMGVGIPDEDAYPRLIERALNKSGNGKYEVINCGIVSYTPLLEYLLLKKYIVLLEPDMVILNFDMSDLLQEYVYRRIAKTDESGVVTAVDGYREYNTRINSVYLKIIMFIRRNLFVTSSIFEILGKQPEDEEELDLNVAAVVERENRKLLVHTLDVPQPEESPQMYGMVEDSILRAKRLCDMYGCVFVLSVYPWGHQVNNREWMPGRYNFIPEEARVSDRTVEELARFARQNGIVFFDAFPSFRGYKGGEPLYFRENPHWASAGHRIMAESLAEFVQGELKNGDRAHANPNPNPMAK
jgi:lysophospholipase L1-like esterase